MHLTAQRHCKALSHRALCNVGSMLEWQAAGRHPVIGRTCHLLVKLIACLSICVGCHHNVRLDITDMSAHTLPAHHSCCRLGRQLIALLTMSPQTHHRPKLLCSQLAHTRSIVLLGPLRDMMCLCSRAKGWHTLVNCSHSFTKGSCLCKQGRWR